MPKFKPQASFATDESIRDYRNGYRKSREITNVYPTYDKLRRGMKAMLNASIDEMVYVSRSRRGEWGEWFEYWSLVNGKPKIIKQGWM
jgi:hypothetical protein